FAGDPETALAMIQAAPSSDPATMTAATMMVTFFAMANPPAELGPPAGAPERCRAAGGPAGEVLPPAGDACVCVRAGTGQGMGHGRTPRRLWPARTSRRHSPAADW